MKMKNILYCIVLITGFLGTTYIANSQMVILSGVSGGSYEQFANDIKKVSDTIPEIEIRTSSGSVDNFEQLTKGDNKIAFTFLQEDVLNHQQLKDLEQGTDLIGDIRILLPLGKEEIHLIVRDDDKINSLKDLKGKNVAIGAPNQGTHITASLVKELTKMKWKDITSTLSFDNVFYDLLNNKIDAFFFVGAAPVSKLIELPPQSKIKIIPLDDSRLEEIYLPTVIPAGIYRCANYSVKTFAVKSVLATSITKEDETRKKNIVKTLKSIRNNIETLQKKGHPKWKEVDFYLKNVDWELYEGIEDIYFPRTKLSPEIFLLSGIKGSSYYQFAEDIDNITDAVNGVKASSGSSYNLRQIIRRNEFFVTFLQYDVLVQQRLDDLQDGTDFTNNIRIIMPFSQEEIHLITRKDSEINSLKDLKKKRVAVGDINQGTFVTASLIKKLTGGKWEDVSMPFDDNLFTALLNNRIDAFFFVGSAPVNVLHRLPDRTNFKLVPIEDKKLNDVYTATTVKAGTYPWQNIDVNTYAVKAVLATNIDQESPEQNKSIKKMLSDIKENIETLRQTGHPKWKEFTFSYDGINWAIYKGAKEIVTSK